jgi:hypothetical protein
MVEQGLSQLTTRIIQIKAKESTFSEHSNKGKIWSQISQKGIYKITGRSIICTHQTQTLLANQAFGITIFLTFALIYIYEYSTLWIICYHLNEDKQVKS